MTLNKYQKANEFIRLSEDQKESIVANLLKEEITPARKPLFVFRPWMAGLTAAFAVLILYFGVFHRTGAPMPAPAMNETAYAPQESLAAGGDSASALSDEAPAAEPETFAAAEPANTKIKEEHPSEILTGGYRESASGTTADAASQTIRILSGQEAEAFDAQSYGEKRETVILDTEVSVYGNRAAVFSANGEPMAVICEKQMSEEEMDGLIRDVIRDFGN
ncbi:MAG: hypothetical protein IKD68_09655 [Solobacterium sp.]|nr:hypothetical protein [Solobacterium sp.]